MSLVVDFYDEHVERELLDELKVICSWHQRFFGTEFVIREAAPGHENDSASHGICPECLEKARREK